MGPANVGQETMREVTKGFFLESKLSGRDIAALARGARNSGAGDVNDLAKVGAGGRHPQNAARNLMRALLKETDMPPLFHHPVKLWNKETNQQDMITIPFLLPHQVLASVGDRWNTMALDATGAPQIWS